MKKNKGLKQTEDELKSKFENCVHWKIMEDNKTNLIFEIAYYYVNDDLEINTDAENILNKVEKLITKEIYELKVKNNLIVS